MQHLVMGTGINCQDSVRYYYGCENCDAIGTEVWWSDVYGAHTLDTSFTFSNGQHYHICLQDGCVYTTEKVNCSGGTATCQERAVCDACKNEYGSTLAHNFDGEWEQDEDNHWKECACGDKANMAEHIDENADSECDICGYATSNTSEDTSHEGETHWIVVVMNAIINFFKELFGFFQKLFYGFGI